MRQIKFRAWDGKEMINPYCELKELNRFWGEDLTNNCFGDIQAVMQFTGLTDKNGKEIYEGDMYTHNGRSFLVVISENFSTVSIEINKNLGSILTDRLVMNNHNYRGYHEIRNIKKYIEVIGNIHETPDLLK